MGSGGGTDKAARRRRGREATRAAAAAADARGPSSPSASAASEAARKAIDLRPPRGEARRRMREALAEAGRLGRYTQGAAATVGLLVPVLVGALFVRDSLASELLIAGGAMVGVFGGLYLHEEALAAIRLRRLIAIGRGLDVDGYLRALGKNRHSAVVEVRATFAAPWPDAARAAAPVEVPSWLPSVGASWAGSDLVVRSGSISATMWHSGGRSGSSFRAFDNAALHGCFMDILRSVVPRLEAIAPIAQLSVELVGDVARPGATP